MSSPSAESGKSVPMLWNRVSGAGVGTGIGTGAAAGVGAGVGNRCRRSWRTDSASGAHRRLNDARADPGTDVSPTPAPTPTPTPEPKPTSDRLPSMPGCWALRMPKPLGSMGFGRPSQSRDRDSLTLSKYQVSTNVMWHRDRDGLERPTFCLRRGIRTPDCSTLAIVHCWHTECDPDCDCENVYASATRLRLYHRRTTSALMLTAVQLGCVPAARSHLDAHSVHDSIGSNADCRSL
jgi:hypothetical protein